MPVNDYHKFNKMIKFQNFIILSELVIYNLTYAIAHIAYYNQNKER